MSEPRDALAGQDTEAATGGNDSAQLAGAGEPKRDEQRRCENPIGGDRWSSRSCKRLRCGRTRDCGANRFAPIPTPGVLSANVLRVSMGSAGCLDPRGAVMTCRYCGARTFRVDVRTWRGPRRADGVVFRRSCLRCGANRSEFTQRWRAEVRRFGDRRKTIAIRLSDGALFLPRQVSVRSPAVPADGVTSQELEGR